MVMRKSVLILAGLAMAVGAQAQGGFESPADTVYLRLGPTVTVHVKSIEKSTRDVGSAYRIRTHESLDLTDKDIWSTWDGGYRWTAEQFADGFKSLDVVKVVFADGFVLPFEGGELDRSLLLKAPSYQGAHGDFLAEGVVELTRDELRRLIGEEAYLLDYRVRKTQAQAGLGKFIVGASSGFLCYLTRDNAILERLTDGSSGSVKDELGTISTQYNPVWQTGTALAAVTAVYGAGEMALANISIRRLAHSFRDYEAPSSRSFRNRALAGGGLALTGGALAFLGYRRIAKDEGWTTTYAVETVAGQEVRTVVRREGVKMAVPWLLPAAGALLLNVGVTQLTTGLTGLSGCAKLRAAGLDRAQLQFAPTPCGLGISMVF